MPLSEIYYLNNLRTIVLSEEIDEYVAYEIVSYIRQINDHDSTEETKPRSRHEEVYQSRNYNEEGNYIRRPIKVIVNTLGGQIYHGMSIITAMTSSVTPVHTYSFGPCMSMGVDIFLAGEERWASSRFSTFMIHGGSEGIYGNIEQVERALDQLKSIENVGRDWYLERTKITKTKLTSKLKKEEDWYIRGKELFTLGIAHFDLDEDKFND